jgi:hypothetical protein
MNGARGKEETGRNRRKMKRKTHLRLPTPFPSLRDHPTIFLKSSIIHHPIISSSSSIFPSNRRQESDEIVFMLSHILSCGSTGY